MRGAAGLGEAAIDRVVILNDLSEPKGGATALALASALALRARGVPVAFLAGDVGSNPALAAAGVEVVALGQARLESMGRLRAFAGGLYNPAAHAMAARWIAMHDTPGTVYHLHGWAQILSPSVLAALRAVQPRTLLHAHDFFLACPNGSFSDLKTGAVCPLTPLSASCIAANCDRRAYAHKLWRVTRQAVLGRVGGIGQAPAVLAIHEAMRAYLMRGGIANSAIETLPNPVRPWSPTRIAAENNGEFLFVGRLEATKGPDLAAAAARAAGVPLRFVGSGVMEARLRADYPEMAFSGHVPPEGIGAIAAKARALLMPSRYPEPYGLVAAEALWSGLPVIAAETAFLSRDIVAAGAGAAVDPRDTAAFAATLRHVRDDDAVTQAMSLAAFGGTRAIGLDPEVWINQLLAAYRKRLAAPSLARAA